MSKSKNHSAFPVPRLGGGEGADGLSKRELASIHLMVGLVSKTGVTSDLEPEAPESNGHLLFAAYAAKYACILADALAKEWDKNLS